MKKLILLLVLVIVPLATFADFQIGPTALYNLRISNPNQVKLSGISLSDFTFGLDSRLNLGIFQGSAYALVSPGSVDQGVVPPTYIPTTASLFLDVGLCIDILFVRLAAGIGPNFNFYFNDPNMSNPDIFAAGANIKLAADLMLGGISVGLVYFMDTNLTKQGVAEAFQKWDGQLGLSLLFKLF